MMKNTFFSVVALLFSLAAAAQTTDPKFPLGNGLDKWGVPLVVPGSDISLRLGARLQSLTTFEKVEDLDADTETTSQDFQLRRVRFQFQADLPNKAFFTMDVRNDNANEDDKGEGTFNVGDAYVSVPLWEGATHAFRVYRVKVDVARTETISSSEILFVNRPQVADEAAQFVSHNRRAANAQLVGVFFKKLSYQLAVGDGVQSDRFKDARGKTGNEAKIIKQNFMVGGKLRFSPFTGWEDLKPTETYFGEGKHFSVGLGAFNTSNIHFKTNNNEGTVSRNLVNAEASAHYYNWTIQSEYFMMDGVIENHAAAGVPLNKGKGEGWYVQSEYLLPHLHFFAPFARYEKWNRFIESDGFTAESNLFGLNWYLNGNRFRVTAAYERQNLGRAISGGKQRQEAFHLASMWHF